MAAGSAPQRGASSATPVNGFVGHVPLGMFAFTAAASAATGYVPVFFTAKSSIASWKLCMFAFTLASRALFCIAMKLGIAMAARIPIITTTIMSSISVKPFWFRNMVVLLSGLPSLAIDELQRQQGRLSVSLDGIARRRDGIRTVTAHGRGVRAPERCLVRHASERVGRPRTARHVRLHGRGIRRHGIRARVL